MPPLTDPLGRRIRLTDDAWYGHIIKGHPEMRGLRDGVESGIVSPLAIHLSNSDADCRLYYVNGPRFGLLICIVADVELGFVKTASDQTDQAGRSGMATAQSIEGNAGVFWFHYDLSNDVLYLRLASARDLEACGEENDAGLIVLRSVADDRPVGMTVVNWWKRFGAGLLPDSVREIAARIEPWAERARTAA